VRNKIFLLEVGGSMSVYDLPKVYDFKGVEDRLYTWWEEQGFFRPILNLDQEPYVISMPPPNVTGELHLGHAITLAIEDLMIRHSRMKRIPTLWVPGTDHAGIATQLQVETSLRKEGLSREQLGREAFIQRTWEWKEKFGGIITQQVRKIGASCDWERERFTLDEGLSKAVREAFVQLYERGLIYRGAYLVNWSPGLKTAVSNLEVEYFEEEGKLYYFNYPVADSEEAIPVATTRPETILGDTAVAIHPDDDRFKHLLGRMCLVPILERPIPIIEDSYVDLEFGTGALKITPGHDQADYEIGQRHGLEIINVLSPDAKMNENAGPYEGLDRYECREKLWEDMEAAGLTIKVEPYMMQVPRSQRGGEAIEPMISTQWFVKMDPLAKPALEAVRDGRIRIIPDRFAAVYYNWLENIKDWCISRQLWWGHQIPAWHCAACGKVTVSREDPDRCGHCGSENIEQDPDVLDTWFSSGLWPFSTLGWPDQPDDYRRFYPTTMMETGYDILFFWVARMIMMGLAFTDDVPFHYVYLHGLVRDENGRKMSKSLGNAIDPLELMGEYGTDALRFTLLTGSTPGNDMNLSVNKVESSRNFANKLWNAGRLVISALEGTPTKVDSSPEYSLADRWILARLSQLNQDVNRLFDTYQYGEAGRQVYDFFWGEFADWYLEVAKLQLNEGDHAYWRSVKTMIVVLDACLRMLHPFIPFVTEELWNHLKRACQQHPASFDPDRPWEQALMVAQWPEIEEDHEIDLEAIKDFSLIMDLIRSIRNIRSEKKVEAGQKIVCKIQAGEALELIQSMETVISTLAHLDPERFEVAKVLEQPPLDSVPLVVGTIEAYLPLSGMVDLEVELRRITRELENVETQIARLKELLAGPFSSRAPQDIVEKEVEKLAALEDTAQKLHSQKKALS
jgi:valyl-tRNA synthetase